VNSWKKLLDSTIAQPEIKKKMVVTAKKQNLTPSQVSEDLNKKRTTASSAPEDRLAKKLRQSANYSTSSNNRPTHSEVLTKSEVQKKKDTTSDKVS